jgi:hypothetical protein
MNKTRSPIREILCKEDPVRLEIMVFNNNFKIFSIQTLLKLTKIIKMFKLIQISLFIITYSKINLFFKFKILLIQIQTIIKVKTISKGIISQIIYRSSPISTSLFIMIKTRDRKVKFNKNKKNNYPTSHRIRKIRIKWM